MREFTRNNNMGLVLSGNQTRVLQEKLNDLATEGELAALTFECWPMDNGIVFDLDVTVDVYDGLRKYGSDHTNQHKFSVNDRGEVT